jgi:hypothetical protein
MCFSQTNAPQSVHVWILPGFPHIEHRPGLCIQTPLEFDEIKADQGRGQRAYEIGGGFIPHTHLLEYPCNRVKNAS